jgi:hypothetical protein
MGRQIVKQPDGLFAVWSSIVDDFIFENATEKELRQWWLGESIMDAIEKSDRDLEEAFSYIERFGKDKFGDTYDNLVKIHDRVHKCNDCNLDNPDCNLCLGS